MCSTRRCHHRLKTVAQPRFKVKFGYTKLVYQAWLEAFDLLKAHEFRVLVCSGGGSGLHAHT